MQRSSLKDNWLLEEYVDSIFRFEQLDKQETSTQTLLYIFNFEILSTLAD